MKSIGLPDEIIKPPALIQSYNIFYIPKFQVEFNESCLMPDRATFTPIKIINLYITYEIKSWPFYIDNGFNLRNALFGAAKMATNPDPDKYFDFEYYISFDIHGTSSLQNGGFTKQGNKFESLH